MHRPIRRALLSVSDKTGLVEFATELHQKYGVELIATGGTRKLLTDAGLPVRDVAELTNFPEILDGRVKTLHPAIYAGLLAKRSKPEHMQTLAEHSLPEIDLVVCNLYPFEQTVAKPGVTEAEAIENIDIGGPCMVRAAAKNFESVAVIVSPGAYQHVLQRLREQNGSLTKLERHTLGAAAFQLIADYDQASRSVTSDTNTTRSHSRSGVCRKSTRCDTARIPISQRSSTPRTETPARACPPPSSSTVRN
jgi:phosphoribosylaminoimidazolecarboxamide formyltransferase / IMP cyclohydrolase